jgi:tetratricopeptide (TPR) repeat protein
MERADVNAALGIVYGELGQFDNALERLDAAIAANKAELSVRALEQRANFRVLRALQTWQTGRGAAKPKRGAAVTEGEAAAEIMAAIEDLAALSRMGSTVERYSLLGSAYKRLAWVQSIDNASEEALANMGASYYAALQQGAQSKKLDPYPLTNWLTAEAILSWHGIEAAAEDWRALAQGLCDRAIEEAARGDQSDPNFWNSAVEPDCRLVLGIIRGGFDDAAKRAMDTGASPKEKDSVRAHLEFVAEMAQRAGKSALAKSLSAMREELAV